MSIQALLRRPDSWCQLRSAMTRDGTTVDPSHPRATQWCIWGAIQRCYRDEDRDEIAIRITRAIGLPAHACVVGWNDTPGRTHAEVWRAVTRAKV